jgi:AcrR family transcriptional regulator
MGGLVEDQVNIGRKGAELKRARRMMRPQRRLQLLEAATEIVKTSGIASLTMAALAQQAGVSKPVAYEHFANSEEVSLALLDDYFINIVSAVKARTEDAETLEAYISALIDAEFDFHAGGALSIRSITNGHTSSHATGDRLNAAFLKIRKQAAGSFRDLLQQQGVPEAVAGIAGYVLAEMLNNTVPEYADTYSSDRARNILKVMMIESIHAICPAGMTKPKTPDWIMDELKRAIASKNANR